MSGSQCSISRRRLGNARCRLPRSLHEPHTCEPGDKHAASCQDLGFAFRVALLRVSAGPFEEGFTVSFNMQLLQGVHHLRRVHLRPEDYPQRRLVTVSTASVCDVMKACFL